MNKTRFLSLYLCAPWGSTTKSNGSISLKHPRFYLAAFTQPMYAANFAKGSTLNVFFQRFLMSVPPEKFVKRAEEKKMHCECAELNNLDIGNLLQHLYSDGSTNKIILTLSADAEKLYDDYHDEIADYRMKDRWEERIVSIISKSLGLAMRQSGI